MLIGALLLFVFFFFFWPQRSGTRSLSLATASVTSTRNAWEQWTSWTTFPTGASPAALGTGRTVWLIGCATATAPTTAASPLTHRDVADRPADFKKCIPGKLKNCRMAFQMTKGLAKVKLGILKDCP